MDYEAFLVSSELSNARALGIAEEWLRASKYPREGVIVVNTLKIVKDVPELEALARKYRVASPHMDDLPTGGGHPVLAPWVVVDALELAEQLASSGGGLLVIDSDPRHESVEAWIARTGASRLA